MADQVVSDLIMKFVLPSGEPIEGESSSVLSLKKSDMSKGFEPGRMFEVESFSFRTGIGGEDAETTREMDAYEKRKADINKANAIIKRAHARNQGNDRTSRPTLFPLPDAPSSVGAYERWRNGGQTKYPVDMSPIEFTRGVDKASAVLLQNCIERQTYKSATLIKRKAAGGAASGEIFLRFDFDTVLMTRVEWSDDFPIKETCQFICRALTLHYRPQLANGSLGGAIQKFWAVDTQLKPFSLRG